MHKLEKILAVGDFGWIQIVGNIPPKPKALIILCHGLTGDKSGPQRILSHWANILYDYGYLVVRFDFRGSGDSSGSFQETTISQMQQDLESVIKWCYNTFTFSKLILGGLSLGGLVALKTMPHYLDCAALFLFSSDINDNPYFDLCEDPLPIREGQFYIQKKYFEERLALKPGEILLSNTSTRCFLIYGQHDDKISRMAKTLKGSNAKIKIFEVENTGHLFESLSARSNAIHIMINELNQLNQR